MIFKTPPKCELHGVIIIIFLKKKRKENLDNHPKQAQRERKGPESRNTCLEAPEKTVVKWKKPTVSLSHEPETRTPRRLCRARNRGNPTS